MPRLHVWAVCSVITATTGYLGYHSYYQPLVAFQEQEERSVTARKMGLQEVICQFNLLQHAVEQALHSCNLRDFGATPQSGNASESCFVTNKEKLLLYCSIQRIRNLLFGLPLRAQCEREFDALLSSLDDTERIYCGVLNFRDEALTLGQVIWCFTCYVCYTMVFRLLPLLWRPSSPLALYQVYHLVAASITKTLEIETSLSVSRDVGSDARGNQLESASEPATDGRAPSYLVLNAVHWIEDVGFWACANNPLLHPERDRWHLSILQKRHDRYPAATSWAESFVGRPQLQAYALPFDRLWTRVGSERKLSQEEALHRTRVLLEEMRGPTAVLTTAAMTEWTTPTAAKSPTEETEGRCSLGYPLTCDTSRLQRSETNADDSTSPQPTRPWVPVGVAGLPRVLFVGPLAAREDIRQSLRSNAVFRYLRDAQEQPNTTRVPVGTPRTTAPLEDWLRQLQQVAGVTCWSPVWWGGVYGGVTWRGRTVKRRLHYHIGVPSTAVEFTEHHIDAATLAVEAAYSA